MSGLMVMKTNLHGSPRVPLEIEVAQAKLLATICQRLVFIASTESRSKRIAAGTRVVRFLGDQALIVVGEGVPFARIRDAGGNIWAQEGKMLRFADGTFRHRSHQTGLHFMRKGEQAFPGLVAFSYREAFQRLS